MQNRDKKFWRALSILNSEIGWVKKFFLCPLRAKDNSSISFMGPLEVDFFFTERAAIEEAKKRNAQSGDVVYNVHMEQPAGDDALIWCHKIGHTFAG